MTRTLLAFFGLAVGSAAAAEPGSPSARIDARVNAGLAGAEPAPPRPTPSSCGGRTST